MNVVTETFGQKRVESFGEYFQRALGPGLEYDGVIENTVARAEKNSAAIGKLAKILAENGWLKADDLLKITGTYEDKISFTEDNCV